MGRKRIVYAPDAFVCVAVFTEVPTFTAVTFAPTMTAPLGSVTWPVMDPVTVWPRAADVKKKVASENPTTWRSSCLLIRSSIHFKLVRVLTLVIDSCARWIRIPSFFFAPRGFRPEGPYQEESGSRMAVVKKNLIESARNDQII